MICPRRSRIRARTWVLGVQWHPEVDPDSQIIDAFVDAVRDGAARAAAR